MMQQVRRWKLVSTDNNIHIWKSESPIQSKQMQGQNPMRFRKTDKKKIKKNT